MIRTHIVLATAFALTATAGYAQNADTAGVAKTRTAIEKAEAAQDAAGIARLFTADGVEMPPNAPAAKGRAAIEAYNKSMAQQFMNHGITITATDTKVLGDTAYDVGTYKQTLMAMKGGAMIEDKGKYLVVLKKQGADWLIAYAIYNSDNPPPAPAPAKK
jgi:uncharacterized protein (TIGR02246 family)